MKVKIKDIVKLTKEITFDGGFLEKGTEGEVVNLLEVKKEKYAVFRPVDGLSFYVVSVNNISK